MLNITFNNSIKCFCEDYEKVKHHDYIKKILELVEKGEIQQQSHNKQKSIQNMWSRDVGSLDNSVFIKATIKGDKIFIDELHNFNNKKGGDMHINNEDIKFIIKNMREDVENVFSRSNRMKTQLDLIEKFSSQNQSLKFNFSGISLPYDTDDVLIVFNDEDEGVMEYGVGYYDPEQNKWFLKLATNYMCWPTQYKILRWASLEQM